MESRDKYMTTDGTTGRKIFLWLSAPNSIRMQETLSIVNKQLRSELQFKSVEEYQLWAEQNIKTRKSKRWRRLE